MTDDGTWNHTWNYNNTLANSNDGTNISSYLYDANKNRVQLEENGVITHYPNSDYKVKNPGSLTPEITIDFNLGDILIASSMNGTLEQVHTDHLGGTQLTTDSTGTIQQLNDYYPYGDLRIDTNTGFNDVDHKYTGHEYDRSTNLHYQGARYYDSGRARFISQDPVALMNPNKVLTDPQQLNMYSYARNNPVVFVDPDGKEPVKIYAGTISDFISIMNNSPRQVGLFTGNDASNYMNSLGNVSYSFKNFFKPEPSQASYYNNKQGRYIYTENGGWIDMAHFVFYAGKAYSAKLDGNSNPVGEAVQAGFRQEFMDITTARHSAYSYEDLPSDWFGADFATNHFDPNSKSTLGDQLQKYFTNVLNATDPKNASNYDNLPEKDSRNLPSSTNGSTKPKLFNKNHD